MIQFKFKDIYPWIKINMLQLPDVSPNLYHAHFCKNLIIFFRVCKSVHHHTDNWINQQNAATSQVYYL